MAYESKDLRLMGGVPGQQLFVYRSGDDAATVTAGGYFTPAAEEYNMDTGDMIIAVSGLGGTMTVDLLVAEKSGEVMNTSV